MSDDLRAFEDIQPGETVRCGPVEITREAIITFAQVYDPQPFHLDEMAARASLLGGLAASGWHTASIGMRLFFDGFLRHVASMGAPGIDDLRWLRPVRPGDALSLIVKVEDTRPSASRADRGFVRILLDLRNGADECVMTQRFSAMIQRRDAGVGHRQSIAPIGPSQKETIPLAHPMLTAFYEDVIIGEETDLGQQLFTPETIIAYAMAYDPQSFHLDAEKAAESHFGGLVASGWQTAAFWMKHYIAARGRSRDMREAAGRPAAAGGPSPGFSTLKWLHPVRAGETITFALKVVGKRPTRRSAWGLVLTENTGRRSDGTPVLSFGGRMLWPVAGA